jgi:2,4-dienoyl-CoA reductase-like NADH-dependent reductase (Old Yellow Enzyme family)
VARLKAVNPKCLFIFQITHAGESSNPAFSRRVSVKPLPEAEPCEVLGETDVERIMDDIVLAARIAHDAGADGIDVKLCHSYLGMQILRPYNDRPWKYGGPWTNRRRFAFELYERIAQSVRDNNFLLGSKVSAWEGWPGGFGSPGPDAPVVDLTEPLDLIKGLEERGACYIIATAGGHASGILIHPDANRIHLAYLHHTYAKTFREHLKPGTVVIGSGYSVFGDGKRALGGAHPDQRSLLAMGAGNIARGYVDMIGLGRQSFADPLLPLKVREGREDEIDFCSACNNCAKLLSHHVHTGCSTHNLYYAGVLAEVNRGARKS